MMRTQTCRPLHVLSSPHSSRCDPAYSLYPSACIICLLCFYEYIDVYYIYILYDSLLTFELITSLTSILYKHCSMWWTKEVSAETLLNKCLSLFAQHVRFHPQSLGLINCLTTHASFYYHKRAR